MLAAAAISLRPVSAGVKATRGMDTDAAQCCHGIRPAGFLWLPQGGNEVLTRDEMINIRCRPDEARLLRSAAAASHRSVSDVVRTAALRESSAILAIRSEPVPEDR